MDAKQLGKRIREIRLAKKMTQSEVVGDFITRHMLSKIESGAAVPSFQTLQHLAKSLDVPISSIVSDTDDAVSLLNHCKRALADEEYSVAIELLKKISLDFYDESEAIGSKAYLGLAKRMADNGDLRGAVTHAKIALEKSQNGIYSSRELYTQCLLLLDTLAQDMNINSGL